jgi:hypothetical protein
MSLMNEDTTMNHNTPQRHPNNDGSSNNCTNNQYLQDKANAISTLLDEPMVDLWALRVHAITDGGLVNGT